MTTNDKMREALIEAEAVLRMDDVYPDLRKMIASALSPAAQPAPVAFAAWYARYHEDACANFGGLSGSPKDLAQDAWEAALAAPAQPATPVAVGDERVAFEADEEMCSVLDLRRHKASGNYVSSHTHFAWKAWQARAALAQKEQQ